VLYIASSEAGEGEQEKAIKLCVTAKKAATHKQDSTTSQSNAS